MISYMLPDPLRSSQQGSFAHLRHRCSRVLHRYHSHTVDSITRHGSKTLERSQSQASVTASRRMLSLAR
ncbi:hypothetical protein VTN77DRAFT_9131 [Rasamsonia byssochlamydoides]|uniref:uncharacterized protein n=1 Tax=Rasamsonia byssochlamydoides TaxID=89139 RepID=UPI00374325C3